MIATSAEAPPIEVSHFSDVLCVWAYVSDIRIDELRRTFGPEIHVRHHVCSVFGDTASRFAAGWSDRGGAAGYGDHVRATADRFEHVSVHADTWSRVCPASSMPAHLDLLAVRNLDDAAADAEPKLPSAFRRFRQAFFAEARDLGDRDVRRALLAECGVDGAAIDEQLRSGRAHASFAADLALARDLDVKLSPSLVFDGGRQRLNGNVGYRIIEANVRELLERPSHGHAHSWC